MRRNDGRDLFVIIDEYDGLSDEEKKYRIDQIWEKLAKMVHDRKSGDCDAQDEGLARRSGRGQ